MPGGQSFDKARFTRLSSWSVVILVMSALVTIRWVSSSSGMSLSGILDAALILCWDRSARPLADSRRKRAGGLCV